MLCARDARSTQTFRALYALGCWLASALSSGCAESLQLQRLETLLRPSGNVAVLFTVDADGGEPVVDLRASNFTLYEDGRLLPPTQSDQRLLRPELAAAQATLLVVDMSASARTSDQQLAITLAVREFVRDVAADQPVAVYAFDGGKNVYEIVSFSAQAGAADQAFELLRRFETRDPSTNLNGAVLQSLAHLDDGFRHSRTPRHFGTLVVFTDGADRAGRVPYQQVIDAIEASPHRVYTVALGHDVDDSILSRLGKTGYVRVDDGAVLHAAFREVRARIERFARRHYLLSYCSRLPPGRHVLEIEAVSNDGQGRRGQLQAPFRAAFTGAHCHSRQLAPVELGDRGRH